MSGSGCESSCGIVVVVFFVIIIIVIIIAASSKTKREDEYSRRKKAYEDALEDLKENPSDTDLRQSALRLGREYAEYSRGMARQEGVTIFDEIALMNDLNAVCGGAEPIPGQEPVRQEDIETRLARLEDLKSKGLISAEECAVRRADILKEI